MSATVETHKVNQFSANVYHLLQQQGSRLRGLVRNEIQNGEFHFYDSYGLTDVFEKVGRHSDTTYAEVPTFRRRNSTKMYYRSELVDLEDKLKMIHDPESQYAKSFMMAFGRKMDQIILAAGLDDVWVKDKDGNESFVALPDSQKFAVGKALNELDYLTLGALRQIKKKFDVNESEEQINLVCGASDISSLLKDPEVTGADYNSVRALVNGEINQYMGINFIRTELISKVAAGSAISFDHTITEEDNVGVGASIVPAGSRRCMAFTSSGILLATASDLKARVDELPQKHYSKQVYASMNMGGIRMEEKKVMEIFTKE